jgi:hypothetical protein
MPQTLVARITCPNCRTSFQTPVEQVLDVRADPSAKERVINGLANVAICPQCRMGGPLDMPFFYHDPDKELALVYMPIGAGQDDLQRQKAIGDLTRSVMDSLPTEERKAYLLQPQVFLSMENLVNKVLEVEGITPEMIEEQRAKANLLGRMVEAESDEVLEAMIKENDDAIDASFFQILTTNLELVQAAGRSDEEQKLAALRGKLLELSSTGQTIKARTEVLAALRKDPTREKLLELLVETSDEATRGVLIVFGRPLVDYVFFQKLTSRIEATTDAKEKKRLTALRKEILEVRDRMEESARAVLEERAGLLRDLMLSSDPENLARRRLAEFDEVFLTVLTGEMQEAQESGDEEAIKALQSVYELVLRLTEETLPPAVRLLNRLMAVEDEADIDKLLEKNRPLVTPQFVAMLEQAQTSVQEDEEASAEAAKRLALVAAKAKALVCENGG